MRHVTVAVPAYAGTVHILTLRSLLHDCVALAGRGDRFSLIDDCGNGQIMDARAEICIKFLALEDSDALVFVDHDVHWEAGALLRLVDYPVDVVAGVYPYRKDPIEFPVRYADTEELWADPETGLLEVAGVPGGFLKISRECLAEMVAHYSDLEFVTDKVPGGKAVGLFEPYRIGKKKLSEDYSFCQRWRDMGGKVWIEPLLNMGHVGNKSFKGNLGEWLQNRE